MANLFKNATMLSFRNAHDFVLQDLLKYSDYDNRFKLHNITWGCIVSFITSRKLRVILNCTHDANPELLFRVRFALVSPDTLLQTEFKQRMLRTFPVDEIFEYEDLESIVEREETCQFLVEIIKDQDIERKVNARKRKLENDYKELLLKGEDSDVTIEVQNKKFKCHKCILKVRSPTFSVMLKHDMEKTNSAVVTISDVGPMAFQEFLLYLYSGNSSHLTRKNVPEVLELADKYDVEDLKAVCMEFMMENITIKNFFEIFQFFHLYDFKMRNMIVNFFCKNSNELLKNEKWLPCLSARPVECTTLIKALSKI